jgi:hypothetical protein
VYALALAVANEAQFERGQIGRVDIVVAVGEPVETRVQKRLLELPDGGGVDHAGTVANLLDEGFPVVEERAVLLHVDVVGRAGPEAPPARQAGDDRVGRIAAGPRRRGRVLPAASHEKQTGREAAHAASLP